VARLPRLTLPGFPHHVIQRGTNRQAVFLKDADRALFLEALYQAARQFQVAVHGYVLMDNHFHLIVTPQTEHSLSKMMQTLGRRYVRYFNDTHGRSGTLWQGRYQSTVIQSETYLMACMVYCDLNPVRAGMVVQPQDYSWSSHLHCIGAKVDRLITPHALFWELGNTPFAREAAYAEMVHAGIEASRMRSITDAVVHGWALGESSFLNSLQKKTLRRVLKSKPGRPSKQQISET
jgi:putative transposase